MENTKSILFFFSDYYERREIDREWERDTERKRARGREGKINLVFTQSERAARIVARNSVIHDPNFSFSSAYSSQIKAYKCSKDNADAKIGQAQAVHATQAPAPRKRGGDNHSESTTEDDDTYVDDDAYVISWAF